jgi:DNA-binding transcriptional ArsR family regulator
VNGDADIAAIGALIADRTRCRLLLALADGRALAASVLAAEAGVAPSTASEHLGKLVDGNLLRAEQHGRHRYYRLAGPHVGQLLEILAEHAPAQPIRSLRDGTRANAIRRARYCYDHLGGKLAVELMSALIERGVLTGGDGHFHPDQTVTDRLSAPGRDVEYRVTTDGARWFENFGVDLPQLQRLRRPLIRYCLDWSEQRHHLAGALGAALATRLFELAWLKPHPDTRAVLITDAGRHCLANALGIHLE